MGDFNVSVGEVRSHAETVGSIASNVRSVAGAASDNVSGGAFGQIGEFFASAITAAAGEVREAMNGASQTVDQVRSGLTQVADDYQATEDHHVHVFTVQEAGEVVS